MSYQTDDGLHEGWDALVYAGDRWPDGRERVQTGDSAPWALVRPVNADGRVDRSGEEEKVPVADGAGWRGQCECGWRGPLWTLAADLDGHDPAARLVYDPEPSPFGDAPTAVEEGIFAEWREHVRPHQELAPLRAAGAEADRADQALTGQVIAAREGGHSWEAIGAALGMRRQSAWERWRGVTP